MRHAFPRTTPTPDEIPGRPRKRSRTAVAAALTGLLMVGSGLSAQAPDIPRELRAQYEAAYFAWDRGDYIPALEAAERILLAPGGEALLEQIALLTGELYHVEEIAADGRALRWSPDGGHATFVTGTGPAIRTHVVAVTPDGVRIVETIEGRDPAFSPGGGQLAYLRVPETREVTAARERERQALLTGESARVNEARAHLQRVEAAAATVTVRDLASGGEVEMEAGGIEKYALGYAADGLLLAIGREPGQLDRTDLFALTDEGPPQRLTDGPGTKGALLMPAADGRIVYTLGADRLVIHDVASGEERVLLGSAPALSRDGSTLAYVAVEQRLDDQLRRGEAAVGADTRGSGHVNALMVVSIRGGEPVTLKSTTLPLANPAISPSGATVAYMTVLRDDWEIFLIDADGQNDRRLTRDIQHDLFPQFLTETRLLGLMGEARHRRSYLYDLEADPLAEIAARALPGDDQRGRIQLFHNNTLRTVAPQYEWEPSPDGTSVLVVADRDGDTLSPERGVYRVDLTRRVTRDELLARIRANLATERALHERARELFAGMEDEVRAAVNDVEVGRIYDHAHALYQFGSKFFTQPGNQLAIEYLASALRNMGYEPELQWFEPRPGFRTANVVATLRGTTNPERINVISSHFDSVEPSPGADDNSSGTTALLEAARVLADRPQSETIRFAFLTAEEAGLLGAFEFVRRARVQGDQIVGVINNDMIGWTRSHRLDNTIRYSNATVRDVQHGAAILFTDLITYDARYVRGTDAHVFYDAYGDIIGGIGSYPILGNPHYHQPHDVLEVINHRLVAEVSRTTVAAIMRLAAGLELGGDS